MKRNIKIILTTFIFVLSIGLVAKTAHGSWIDTLNIIRQNPPSVPTAPSKPEPPTPPTKPEPTSPPTPPCGDPGCPTATPRPSETPVSTQPPGGGTGGFQLGGPPPPGPADPQVLGLSETSSGNLNALLFTLGALCITAGLKVLLPRSSKGKR